MGKLIDLTGKKFGKLTVLSKSHIHYSPSGQRRYYWLCNCDCGGTNTIEGHQLKRGSTKACGCLKRKGVVRKNITGQKFGGLTVLGFSYFHKNHCSYWKCKCECGQEKDMPLTYLRNRTPYHSCGCRTHLSGNKSIYWKGIGDLSGDYFASVKQKARTRNIDFNITIQEMWDKFLSQDKKCAYTGIELDFTLKSRGKLKGTASLDRIDSSKGYTIDNIQWVHKDLNIMKMDLKQEQFIKYCHLVACKYPILNNIE